MERRAYKRVKDGVKVVYKTPGMAKEQDISPIDVGGGGVRLPLEEELSPGSMIELVITVPGDDKALLGVGEVVWSSLDLRTRRYHTGIKLVRMAIDDRKKLIKYVHDKAEEQRL